MLAAGQEAQPEARCVGFTDVEGQGPSCPVPGGWEVILRDGTRVLTHGPDPVPSEELGPIELLAQSGPPVCATDPSTQGHGRVVYAVPRDKTDRYDSMKYQIRDMVNQTNGILRRDAALWNATISYRMLCDGNGLLEVGHAVLPTMSTGDSFSTIVSDLKAQGFQHANAKFWIWYDDGVGGYGGQGTVHWDDRAIASNHNNNGNDYGITYGYAGGNGVRILMHENGHNLGAVQPSAPYQSGGFHCNDGLDIMCYADGGDNSSYTTGRCSVQRWDCGSDTYFHPAPEPESYLATHWNIGARYNRFLAFEDAAPTVRVPLCSPNPVGVGANTTCSFYAEDDSAGIFYSVTWGDGTAERYPLEGTVAPGTAAVLRHQWDEDGAYEVRVVVTDTADPPFVVESATLVQVKCTWTRTGPLLVGLLGVEREGTSSQRLDGIPPACTDKPFTLKGASTLSPVVGPKVADFDLCWTAGETVLACHAEEGDEAGVVPEGTTGATVVFQSGFLGFYRLEVG